MRKTLWSFLLGLVGCAAIAALVPVADAVTIKEQAILVQSKMAPHISRSGQSMHILVTRDNLLSVFLYNWILPSLGGIGLKEDAPGGNLMRDIYKSNAMHRVDQGVSGKCLIVVSAQGLSDSEMGAQLLSLSGRRDLIWRFILMHEAAHCLRNPVTDARLTAVQWRNPANEFAVKFLAESYADAFALMDAWQVDALATDAFMGHLFAWRQSAQLPAVWRTGVALQGLGEELRAGSWVGWGGDVEMMDKASWRVASAALAPQMASNRIDVANMDARVLSMLDRQVVSSPELIN